MPTDQDNIFYGPVERLRQTVAAAPTFQSLVGATGSPAARLEAALAKIYIVGKAGDTEESDRPYAEIDAGADFARTKHASNGHRTGGSLWLLIEANVPAAKTAGYTDAAKWFYQIFGDLILDLFDASAATDPTPYNLNIRSISLPYGPPAREDPKAKRGDYFQGIMTVEWGNL